MMKKKVWFCFCVMLAFVFLFVFLFCKNNMQTSFLSVTRALQKNGTFTIQNHTTDNVYILQTNKKENTYSLYRKKADDSLLRYNISEDEIITDITQDGHWKQHAKIILPASSLLLAEEIIQLIKGQSESTCIIKQYADYLLSAFSTVYNDSSVLINYNALPSVTQDLRSLLKNRDTSKKISLHKEVSATKIVNTFVPFADLAVTQQAVAILSDAVQPQYRETIRTALEQNCSAMSGYSIRTTTSVIGNFHSLEFYKNQECVFTVKKLK